MADREATAGRAIELDGANPAQLIFNSITSPNAEWTEAIGAAGVKAGQIYQKDGWLSSAKVDTNDSPAVQAISAPAWTQPDAPQFASAQDQSSVSSGTLYDITQSGIIGGIRIYVPQVQQDVSYQVIISDETNPADIIAKVVPIPALEQNKWITVVLGNSYVAAGAKIRITLVSLNSNSGTSFQGGWTKGNNDNTLGPATKSWNKNTQNTVVRVDKTDLDDGDRSSELNSVIQGSIIKFSQTSDLTKFEEFVVLKTPVDFPAYVEYSVSVQNIVNGGVNVGETTTVDFDIPIPQFTQYYRDDFFWSANPITFGTATGFLEFNNVDQAGETDSAFGIDLNFQAVEYSDDWNFLAYTSGILGASDASDTSVSLANDTASLSKPPYLNQTITQNYTNSMTMVGTLDDKLETPVGPIPTNTVIGDPLLVGYQPLTGIVQGLNNRVYQTGFDVSFEDLGIFEADGFATFSHTVNNSTVAFVYSIEIGGDWYFSARPVRHKTPNGDGVANMAGTGVLPVTDRAQKIRLWVASDNNGDVICDTLSIMLKKISDL